jgi:LPXTG-motif cell wall-anchored protein
VTTTTEGEQLPPLLPPTTAQPTTTAVAGALPPTGQLPATGASRSSSTLATGAVLLIAGLAFLVLSRRQTRS